MSKPYILKIVCGTITEFDGLPVTELFKSKTRILFKVNTSDQWYAYKVDSDSLYALYKKDIYMLLIKLMAFGNPTVHKVVKL